MKESEIKSCWTRFALQRGPVWSLAEMLENEPPEAEPNDCGVFCTFANIVIYDAKNSNLLVCLTKYKGKYYTSIHAENTDSNSGGHGYNPGISSYHPQSFDKVEAVKLALKQELCKSWMLWDAVMSVKSAWDWINGLNKETERPRAIDAKGQLLIEW